MSDFKFDKLDKNKDWQGIFAQIDDNFEKVAEYLSTIGNRVKVEQFTAKANQTKFQLQGEYNTKRNCLAVYINGSRQWIGAGFNESSSTSFELTTPSENGDIVVAVYNKFYLLNDPEPIDQVILKSPNGSLFEVTINDNGNLITKPYTKD